MDFVNIVLAAMDKTNKTNYWRRLSDNDWIVAGHLMEKGDYPYALFFGHLTLEKMLKALFVAVNDETPPMTHRLVYLAAKCGLDLTDAQAELLEIVTDFNLEARYPDEHLSFHNRCTKPFATDYMRRIEEIRQWLQQKMPSSAT